MDIGQNIARAREKAGLSQAELGERAGMTQSRVSKIERGEGSPLPEQIVSIADATGATLDALLRGTDYGGYAPGPAEAQLDDIVRIARFLGPEKAMRRLLQDEPDPGRHVSAEDHPPTGTTRREA